MIHADARPAGRLKADLTAILLILLAALLGLSLIWPGSAGGVGRLLVEFLRFWMGHLVNGAPLVLLGAAMLLAFDGRRTTVPLMVAGYSGLLAVVLGWLHLLSLPDGDYWASTVARFLALTGRGSDLGLVASADGGLLGAAVAWSLQLIGRTGSFVALSLGGLASLLCVTQLTIKGILERTAERSKQAARVAKRGAGVAAQGARNVAARLPSRRKQDLFLELNSGQREAEPAAARGREKHERAGANLPVPVLEIAPVEMRPGVPRTISRRTRSVSPPPAAPGEYVLPPLELLDAPVPRPKRSAAETEANIEILESTLGQFRIQAQVVEIADGPSVTRYEIRLGEGIRVKKILDLADNIAMSLAAMSVRVEAPIPGKAAIGIEVPKKHSAIVTLRECLESDEFRDFGSRITFVLGKDVAGNVRCADLAKMPHLLVAGATNSGKSVCLNSLIASLLYRSRPDELKLIMIDPKRVELTLFDGIPHLIHPVVRDVKQSAGILRWVLKEMDRRYDLFSSVMTRNIDGYNAKMDEEPEKRLPLIVVVIDELADLMMQQGPEIEQSICRLAQLARATGIHLVIATQRPSVDVITGLIKANIPSRIAFSVSSQIDSRTVLDGKGAESLVGRGDMLFKPVDAAKAIRIQGAFLREAEVEAVVKYLRTQGKPEFVAQAISVDHGAAGVESEEEVEDELFEPAARFIVTSGSGSTSLIQRKFKIGYTRAARLVDMMEARSILGPLDGARPREILISRAGLDEMFMQTRDSLFRADRGGKGARGLHQDDADSPFVEDGEEDDDDDYVTPLDPAGDEIVEIEETIRR